MAAPTKKKTTAPKPGNFYVFGSSCGDDTQLVVVGKSHATEALAKAAAIVASEKKSSYGGGLEHKAVKVFQLIGKMDVKPPEYVEV